MIDFAGNQVTCVDGTIAKIYRLDINTLTSSSSTSMPHAPTDIIMLLNITSIDLVRLAFQDLVDTARQKFPDLHINGVTIEPHRSRPNARELMIRVFHDPVFGPVISFGAGGHHLEVFRDRAVSLPPLNRFLARNLIDATSETEDDERG